MFSGSTHFFGRLAGGVIAKVTGIADQEPVPSVRIRKVSKEEAQRMLLNSCQGGLRVKLIDLQTIRETHGNNVVSQQIIDALIESNTTIYKIKSHQEVTGGEITQLKDQIKELSQNQQMTVESLYLVLSYLDSYPNKKVERRNSLGS